MTYERGGRDDVNEQLELKVWTEGQFVVQPVFEA